MAAVAAAVRHPASDRENGQERDNVFHHICLLTRESMRPRLNAP
jgi:hypothetical protein